MNHFEFDEFDEIMSVTRTTHTSITFHVTLSLSQHNYNIQIRTIRTTGSKGAKCYSKMMQNGTQTQLAPRINTLALLVRLKVVAAAFQFVCSSRLTAG